MKFIKSLIITFCSIINLTSLSFAQDNKSNETINQRISVSLNHRHLSSLLTQSIDQADSGIYAMMKFKEELPQNLSNKISEIRQITRQLSTLDRDDQISKYESLTQKFNQKLLELVEIADNLPEKDRSVITNNNNSIADTISQYEYSSNGPFSISNYLKQLKKE